MRGCPLPGCGARINRWGGGTVHTDTHRVFLTITTTGTTDRPATDLGFLLHKHPDKAQRFSTAYGTAHVFYPEADAERCTAALLLEVDPVALVRRGSGKGRGGTPDGALARYVNDRPYAASSLLAVALRSVFASAMAGRCVARPELVGRPLPLRIEVPVLPARGGGALVERLFRPLGWSVRAEPLPLDETFPEWGDSHYVPLVLEGSCELAAALRHLYVLLPVLNDAQHHWVAPDEVDKLLRAGEGWLAGHPEQRLILGRCLARRGALAREAMARLELERLAETDDAAVEEIDNAVDETADTEERPVPLAVRRRDAILGVLRSAGAARVLDLGCGQGQLIGALLEETQFTEIVGWTSRCGRSRRPGAGSTWSGCPSGRRSACGCSRVRWRTWTPDSRASTRRCSARSWSTWTRSGCRRWSTRCSAPPGPGRSS